MRKGQIFSTDLVVSLIAVVAMLGLLAIGFDVFLQDSTSTVESVKMHQIAADAAAITHYYKHDTGATGNDYGKLNVSAASLGFIMDVDGSAYQACMAVSRGSKGNETGVMVCR